jgi:hypothetical protein
LSKLTEQQPASMSQRNLAVVQGAASRPDSSAPSAEMMCWPVSPRFGNVRNNELSLIDRIGLQ